jgi:hypothetical protein
VDPWSPARPGSDAARDIGQRRRQARCRLDQIAEAFFTENTEVPILAGAEQC